MEVSEFVLDDMVTVLGAMGIPSSAPGKRKFIVEKIVGFNQITNRAYEISKSDSGSSEYGTRQGCVFAVSSRLGPNVQPSARRRWAHTSCVFSARRSVRAWSESGKTTSSVGMGLG